MQAIAQVTPELIEKLTAWSEKVGLPLNEIQNTVFRFGLLMLATIIKDETFSDSDPIRLIPLSEAEKEAFKNKVN